MRKRKGLFVNGCDCKSLISVTTENVTLWQFVKNTALCSGIMLKNDGISSGNSRTRIIYRLLKRNFVGRVFILTDVTTPFRYKKFNRQISNTFLQQYQDMSLKAGIFTTRILLL
jgi:hypothetical protein